MPDNYEQYFGTVYANLIEELVAGDAQTHHRRFAVVITNPDHDGGRPYTLVSCDTVWQAIGVARTRIDRFRRTGQTNVKVEVRDSHGTASTQVDPRTLQPALQAPTIQEAHNALAEEPQIVTTTERRDNLARRPNELPLLKRIITESKAFRPQGNNTCRFPATLSSSRS
jgi:hypothetical protein